MKRQGWHLWLPGILVAAVSIPLSIRLFQWISRFDVKIFFSDQWDFNSGTLFEVHSLLEMLRWQHGPHRQGLGALASRFIEPHFRWSSRTSPFSLER